jgi:hypothetical protein
MKGNFLSILLFLGFLNKFFRGYYCKSVVTLYNRVRADRLEKLLILHLGVGSKGDLTAVYLTLFFLMQKYPAYVPVAIPYSRYNALRNILNM